jgi:beta-lactamase regulating signal transducer with metallopeptidase domain
MQRIKGMIDVPIEELLFSALAWVCIAAWRALPLLCLVLVFDLLLRRRIAARFHCLLWLIVALRMLAPVSVESSWSIHGNLLTALEAIGFSNSQGHAPYSNNVQNLAGDFETYSYENDKGEVTTVSLQQMPRNTPQDAKFAESSQPYAAPRHAFIANDKPAALDSETIVFIGIAGLWLIVAAFQIIRGVVQSLRFSLQLRHSKLITEQAVVDEMLRACDAVGVGRRPALKEVAGLTVPAVFGIRRPTICLPTGTVDELSSTDLRLVIRHELAHVRRRDGLVLSLCLFVRALHWFNPMAWLVVSRIRNYMEQAADEIAMRTSTTSEGTDYGRLLLHYASNEPKPRHLVAIGLLFTSPGKKLAQRIDMLEGSEQRNHWLARTLAMATVGILAVTGLTDAKPDEQERPPARALFLPRVQDSWNQIQPDFPTAPEVVQVTEERVYDVSKVLTKLKETQPDRDSASFLQQIVAPGETTLSGDQLTVNVTEERHRTVEQRLEQLARSGNWEIQFELRLIQVALDQVSNLGVDWIADAVQPKIDRKPQFGFRPDSEGVLAGFDVPTSDDLVIQLRQSNLPSQPVLGVKITDEQVRRFVQRTAKDVRSSMMLAPKVRVFNGMSACVSDEAIHPFVTGMRPHDPGKGRQMDPVIDCFNEGFRFHIRGDVSDENQIRIQCALTLSKLEDVALANLPINTDDDSGARLTVQVPQTKSVTVHAGGVFKKSESLLLTCPTTFTSDQPRQESHALCYLVTPRWSRDIGGELATKSATAASDQSAPATSKPDETTK